MKGHKRRSDKSTRSKLRSPGRPAVWHRKNLCRFWRAVASGRSSEDAAVDAGVSAPVSARWFRSGGGVPPTHLAPWAKSTSGRYLTFREREDIAIERARGSGIRAIARKLGRAPSTISRELRRNAATRGGNPDYRASTAQWHADRAARRPRPGKWLMTIPSADMRVAPAMTAAIGPIGCFTSPHKLVSYLGLNASVRQPGPGPACHGRITKQGCGHARGMLAEAAWAAARAPGLLGAFFPRVRARRGQHVAAVATARNLAVVSLRMWLRRSERTKLSPSEGSQPKAA